VLGGYHRSRGIWGRFVDDTGNFSNATELIPDIENVLPEAPPINTQPIVPTYQILLPVAIK
jgi:hypothetical protein